MDYPYKEELGDVVLKLENMTDTYFREDEGLPTPVPNHQNLNCHKYQCLDSEKKYLTSFGSMYEDDNMSNTTGQLDGVNEEVQTLKLCT